jgi:hypothetical protein
VVKVKVLGAMIKRKRSFSNNHIFFNRDRVMCVLLVFALPLGACSAPPGVSETNITRVESPYANDRLQCYDESGKSHLIEFGPKDLIREPENMTEWIKSQNQLFYSHGILQFYDESGRTHLRAFGQAYTYYDDEDLIDMLYEEAAVVAMGALRVFASPMNTRAPLKMSGIYPIHSEQYTHSVTKNTVVISVLEWNIESAKKANQAADYILENGQSAGSID